MRSSFLRGIPNPLSFQDVSAGDQEREVPLSSLLKLRSPGIEIESSWGSLGDFYCNFKSIELRGMRAFVSEFSEDVVTEKEKQEMFDYMAELGKTFDDLINSLRLCVELLVSFKPLMPDAGAWQEMVDMLEQKIMVGERVKLKKWVH